MDHTTFDSFARRSADLLNRRSLFGGLSAALLTIGGMPNGLEAKKQGKGNGKGRRSAPRRARSG